MKVKKQNKFLKKLNLITKKNLTKDQTKLSLLVLLRDLTTQEHQEKVHQQKLKKKELRNFLTLTMTKAAAPFFDPLN
jgi:hypothetical protein